MNICDVGHRGKAAWRPGLETGALLSNAPSPSPEPLRVRGLEGSQGRFDLTDKTYLEQPPILAGQGSQSQSPGYLPTGIRFISSSVACFGTPRRMSAQAGSLLAVSVPCGRKSVLSRRRFWREQKA